jgi:hypothetical protein
MQFAGKHRGLNEAWLHTRRWCKVFIVSYRRRLPSLGVAYLPQPPQGPGHLSMQFNLILSRLLSFSSLISFILIS